MFGWLKSLFGGMDRTEAASLRAAEAMESIATMIEEARDRIRERLGTAPADAVKPMIEAGGNGSGNGRGKRIAAK